MEYKKIENHLGGEIDPSKLPKYTKIKWIEVYDEYGGTFNPKRNVRFKTPELINYLCDWDKTYLVVTGKITVTNPNDINYNKKLALKTNAPFFSCATRINNVLIDGFQDLDIVMSMYNLTSYYKNYQKTIGSLRNYYKDEPNSGSIGNVDYSIKDSKSFDYKTGLVGKLQGIELQNIKIAVPVNYLSKFFRSLEIPLKNCETSLDLKWNKNFVLTSKATKEADPGVDAPIAGVNNPTAAEFNIADCKLYVPRVTLPTLYENILYRKLKEGFSADVYWDRYRSQMTNQQAGLIKHLMYSTFDNVSKLFVLAFEMKMTDMILKIITCPQERLQTIMF